MFTDMGIIPEQQLSGEESLGEDAIVEYVKLKKTPITAVSVNDVMPHVSQSHRLGTARVGIERMSGELFESPTVEDKEKEIHSLTNEMALQRTCSTPASSARRRPRVRSCGKIISETLLRDRAINSGVTSCPEGTIRDKYIQSFARHKPNFIGGDHDHFIGEVGYTDSQSNKSHLRCDHANREGTTDLLAALFERNADEVAKNEDTLVGHCSVMRVTDTSLWLMFMKRLNLILPQAFPMRRETTCEWERAFVIRMVL
ncbi:unnamed protein product [Toxocara canis]|uniref:Uncharacterized protein n=1 Tax=Toxocara canis TaxID=6265 RepID=A0A183UAX3_TOXCA|nr:unnamed protein product [Toxocara canis]